MHHKHEILDMFINWKKLEIMTGKKIKWLRSDNDIKYKSHPFMKLCQDEGIV